MEDRQQFESTNRRYPVVLGQTSEILQRLGIQTVS